MTEPTFLEAQRRECGELAVILKELGAWDSSPNVAGIENRLLPIFLREVERLVSYYGEGPAPAPPAPRPEPEPSLVCCQCRTSLEHAPYAETPDFRRWCAECLDRVRPTFNPSGCICHYGHVLKK